ncbi:SGNH/GDSL hydrolase family protein [Paenibacillus sp. GD4]|uniref:SGNH/GDSL hydrolase family protein n=1 Tax=Paenibacillus sp. GD4 TaxID=3068890 RepID=UPI002796D6F9|nr:SGNH/GDSL hydrolase family protein [Paenibacillus sp. GD4]MDQ1914796.1 SGNH/GDSL hydrolase family protein [Paenibacillus sp. GD4]
MEPHCKFGNITSKNKDNIVPRAKEIASGRFYYGKGETPMKKMILCFGDSNTWGYNAETDSRFDEETRWTGLLANLLGSSYRVIEEGLPGRTSVFEDPLFEGLSGFNYIYPCMMSHSPLDMVIIMLGTNDTKQRFGVTSYNIAQGITRLAVKAKGIAAGRNGKTPEVLVVCPAPIGPQYIDSKVGSAMGLSCSEKSEGLSSHLAVLLEGSGIHYADARDQVVMNEIDYMHLDAEGHRKMAAFMFHQVKRIVS